MSSLLVPARVRVRAEAVSTASPLATSAAFQMLREGGNAVDAAVAAAWALCVCEPAGSGVGGQTTMLVRLADGRTIVIEGHSRAPATVSRQTVSAREQRQGHRSCTVPSTPATLEYVAKTYGRLAPLRHLDAAIALAEDGFALTRLQCRQVRWVAGYLKEDTLGQRVFLREQRLPKAGDVIRQPELARTLRRFAEHGVEDFYCGHIARDIADDIDSHGGLLTAQDLREAARPIEREPLVGRYGGHSIATAPPPSGGATLLLALRFVEHLRAAGVCDCRLAAAVAARAAFWDRDLRPMAPTATLAEIIEWLGSASASTLATMKAPDRVPAGRAAEEPGETTHLCVSDRWGNVVTLTQSIQSLFGAKKAHPRLGFFYNNYLCACPRRRHPYRLDGGCLPRSNLAPTIVFGSDGQHPLRLALGGAGSRRITSAVLQVIVRVMDGASIEGAVAAPRAHGLKSGTLWIEQPVPEGRLMDQFSDRFAPIVTKRTCDYSMGCVQAIEFSCDGAVRAAADPRRDGEAAVTPVSEPAGGPWEM